jgi:hypothetical protein
VDVVLAHSATTQEVRERAAALQVALGDADRLPLPANELSMLVVWLLEEEA